MSSGGETTFRNFTAQQAKEYNASRGNAYPPKLYEHILAYHKKNGGEVKLALDVGCGPGNATRDLLAYFDQTIGLDGSPEMVNTARELVPEDLKARLRFENVTSENMDKAPGLGRDSVDVITVATAAHWFDLPKFYASASQVLKPGGTVAIWMHGRPSLKPGAAHAAEVNAILEEFREKLQPYRQERRYTTGEMYEELPLPWTLTPTVEGFDEGSYERTVFSDVNNNQLEPSQRYTLAQAERMYGSGSPVVRWREQHPDLTGTDNDIVKHYFNKIRQIVGNDDGFDVNAQYGLLLWKKSA